MPKSASFLPAFASASAISAAVPSTIGVAILRSTHAHAAVMTLASCPSGSTTVPFSFDALSMIFLIAFIPNLSNFQTFKLSNLLTLSPSHLLTLSTPSPCPWRS